MPPLSLPYNFLGRPVKPLPFAAMITMLVITIINLYDVGIAGNAVWGDFISIIAGAAAACLVVGWWKSSQRMSEAGLLAAASVWFARSIFAMITLSPAVYNWAFSMCWAIALSGAYLLERSDGAAKPKEVGWTRRSPRQ